MFNTSEPLKGASLLLAFDQFFLVSQFFFGTDPPLKSNRMKILSYCFIDIIFLLR